MNGNYQKKLDQLLEQFDKEETVKSLLLHSCCAPCSSYVLEYLAEHMKITIFYYNPNIYPPKEYEIRSEEQRILVGKMKTKYPITFLSGIYEPDKFYQAIAGREHIPEGGERCFACYELRLRAAAKAARRQAFDYFTTTLTISPLKKAGKLNELGEQVGREYGVEYLPSDFKKRGGYQRSIILSKQFNLYRQDYCGCIFSKKERTQQLK